MRRHFFFTIVFLFTLGCSQIDQDKRTEPFRVVTTTSMIGDAMRAMLDTNVVVTSLMGPGTDPHLFKPTKQSLDDLAAANLIVANGLHLEGRMQDILEKLGLRKPVIFLGESLSEEELILPEQNADYPDPHIWFDVSLWHRALSGATSKLDSLGILRSDKAMQYFSGLSELHEFTKTEIAEIPEERRVLLTAHDAFSYFGRAYTIEVIGLQGISTVSEYGLRDVEQMVDLISSRNIAAVFVESSISPRSMEAVVSGVQQKGGEVKIGGTLYSDAPGPRGSGAETYTDMVKHNVRTIKSALK